MFKPISAIAGLYRNRLANWLVIPLVTTAYFLAIGPQNQYAGAYSAALKARTTAISGTLMFRDIRHKYLIIETGSRNVSVHCDLYRDSQFCLPDSRIIPVQINADVFLFRDRLIMLAGSTTKGAVILTRSRQLARLKQNSIDVLRLNPEYYAILGALMGMVFALIRDAFLVRQTRESGTKGRS